MSMNDIGKRFRHPNNRYGHGSPEFWEAEYQLYGVTGEEYWRLYKEQAPKCSTCGTTVGMSPGTGDCNCGDEL